MRTPGSPKIIAKPPRPSSTSAPPVSTAGSSQSAGVTLLRHRSPRRESAAWAAQGVTDTSGRDIRRIVNGNSRYLTYLSYFGHCPWFSCGHGCIPGLAMLGVALQRLMCDSAVYGIGEVLCTESRLYWRRRQAGVNSRCLRSACPWYGFKFESRRYSSHNC